jgi:hypothetical protein
MHLKHSRLTFIRRSIKFQHDFTSFLRCSSFYWLNILSVENDRGNLCLKGFICSYLIPMFNIYNASVRMHECINSNDSDSPLSLLFLRMQKKTRFTCLLRNEIQLWICVKKIFAQILSSSIKRLSIISREKIILPERASVRLYGYFFTTSPYHHKTLVKD